jgi:hypothetical protein
VTGEQELDALAAEAPPADAPLSELQLWMAQLLRQKRALHKSDSLKQAAARHFSGNTRLSPAEQVNIYRTQFWLRHTSALIEDYPGLTALVGQEQWEAIAESYLTKIGYQVRTLRDLGKELAQHLEGFPGLENRRLLIDMARLEWAYVEAFDAQDEEPLDHQRLSKIPPESWETARFRISDSLTLLQLSYPVPDLRRELRRAPEDARQRVSSDQEEELYYVVYRRGRELFDKKISRTAFLLLTRLKAGLPLIFACEAVVKAAPEAAQVFDEQLFAWFSLWGRLGWITDVVPQAESP